jgi:glycerophosphoryl diester phosphodiesterase
VTAVYAHRGCTDGFVENTLEAFAEAGRRGADGVELDVRLTADGALAVHHDAEVPGAGPVSTLRVADLPAHVPLLGDVLAVCEGMVVNVEIKNAPQDPGFDPSEAVAGLTAAAIEEARWTGRVLVSSFQVATLRAVQAADGRLALGALWGFGDDPGAALREAAEAGIGAVHPFVGMVTPELVVGARALGLAVNVWTVNAPHDLQAMVALGVDAVITDRLADAMAAARATDQASGEGRVVPS